DVARDTQRAGSADRGIPLGAPETRRHGLELELGGGARALHALLGDHAVGEVLEAETHAAHVEAFEPLGDQPFADDELRAAAADVDHETMTRFAGHGVRDAEVDEPRLLDAGDDLDRVA